MTENEVAKIVVDAAYQIHVKMGPGLLESAYEMVLDHELRKRGLRVERQVAVSVIYDDLVVNDAFRADLIVEDLVIVEIKSVEQIHPVHPKQLLTYLRLTGKRLGLLINFNTRLIREGITRVANGLPD
ncbi:MAG: GxxExxY protein [Chloroflexi bacterium HGW-Chloroflexi-6]|nr:MAG: GxxExxY protein [Chloroflexi bacterium HGW-Chloroflexi-6]